MENKKDEPNLQSGRLMFYDKGTQLFEGVHPNDPQLVTTVIFDGIELKSRIENPGIAAALEPYMPKALFDKIDGEVYCVVLDGSRVHHFGLFSKLQGDGILSTDLVVKDGEWIREESFNLYEGEEDTEEVDADG